MNVLVQFSNQSKTIWKSLSMGSRVTLISFAGVMVALLIGLCMWSSQADYVLLYGGLASEDAAAISVRLNDDKIAFRYEASRGAIYVPASKADNLRLTLASLGLPKNTSEGFEIFDKSSFGTTEFVQHVNYVRALQGMLARNIQAIDGVESARVALSIPEEEVFARDQREAKASVVVKMHAGRLLSPDQVAAIRQLVASSTPKLDARQVTVVDAAGKMMSRPQDSDSIAGLSDDQLGIQKNVEKHLSEKVQSLLDQVLGIGQSAVRVTARLNFERIERNLQKMDPDSGVLLEENSQNEDSTGRVPGPGGVPAVSSDPAKGNAATAQAQDGSTTNIKKHKTTTNRFHYDTTNEKVTSEVGTIKSLSVAVLVAPKQSSAAPAAAGGPAAKAAPTPRTPQELAALTEIVRSAVGYSAERQDVVKVDELPFQEQPDAVTMSMPVSPWMEFAQKYFSDVLAFLGIMVMAALFWKMSSSITVPIAATSTASNATSLSSMVQPVKQSASVTMTIPSEGMKVSLQEEVKQLVTQDNTHAVSVIRSMLR